MDGVDPTKMDSYKSMWDSNIPNSEGRTREFYGGTAHEYGNEFEDFVRDQRKREGKSWNSDSFKKFMSQQDDYRQDPNCAKILQEKWGTEMSETQIRSWCQGAARGSTQMGHQTEYTREYGRILAQIDGKIATENLEKAEAVKLKGKELMKYALRSNQSLAVSGIPPDRGQLRKALNTSYGTKLRDDDANVTNLANIMQKLRGGEFIPDEEKELYVNQMEDILASIETKHSDKRGLVKKITHKAKGKVLGGELQQMSKSERDSFIQAKISGKFGAFQSVTDKRKKADIVSDMIELQVQAKEFGVALPPNISMFLNDEERVEEILAHTEDPRKRDKALELLKGAAEAAPRGPSMHDGVADIHEGASRLASALPDHSGESGMSGPGLTSLGKESENMMTEFGSRQVSAGAMEARAESDMQGQNLASPVMSIKSGVLGKETAGSGTLFEKSMTEAATQGQFSDWRPGERQGFSPMPVSGGSTQGQGFGDIKNLTGQQGIGGQEFLADRGAGKGALSGIVYRPTAGIVGASQVPGGSRWFDFPGADSQQTRGRLDLGMDKQGGPTQAPLSRLGTTSRLGGGAEQSQFPPMNGASIQPQNQFGQDAGNGLASDTSNMGALLGSAIGGPERKSTELDSKKLNLFGSVPRY